MATTSRTTPAQRLYESAPVAQRIERPPSKRLVEGSTPSGGANRHSPIATSTESPVVRVSRIGADQYATGVARRSRPDRAVLVCAASVALTLVVAACGGSVGPAAGGAAPSSGSPSAGPVALDACVPASAHARAVSFTAAGEEVIGAELGNAGNTGIVLAHEYMSNLCGWIPYAEHLRDLGYRVLAFDFGAHLVDDVSGAAETLRHGGARKIVLMGASMGGTASLVAAASAASSVTAVAALSAPSDFMGMDGTMASRQLTIPVLYMAAQDNGEFPGDARAMYAACPASHRELHVLTGSDHGTALLRGDVASQAQSLLDAFVAASVA